MTLQGHKSLCHNPLTQGSHGWKLQKPVAPSSKSKKNRFQVSASPCAEEFRVCLCMGYGLVSSCSTLLLIIKCSADLSCRLRGLQPKCSSCLAIVNSKPIHSQCHAKASWQICGHTQPLQHMSKHSWCVHSALA